MPQQVIRRICTEFFGSEPDGIKRCTVGQGNYVYAVRYGENLYIIRCTPERNAYINTIRYLNLLAAAELPTPRVITGGRMENMEYLILSYIEGTDIGQVYPTLTSREKMQIAKEITAIQTRVSTLPLEAEAGWSWLHFVNGMLERAEGRILRNGFFDVERVERLRREMHRLEGYFLRVKPRPFLDDISTKNLLIQNGRLSGIVDIDEMGFGDRLSYVALTYMALRNCMYSTDYVEYILEEMGPGREERRAFLFYALLYCVDFMGERGMRFTDRVIEAGPETVKRLNGIYEELWALWSSGGVPELEKTGHIPKECRKAGFNRLSVK